MAQLRRARGELRAHGIEQRCGAALHEIEHALEVLCRPVIGIRNLADAEVGGEIEKQGETAAIRARLKRLQRLQILKIQSQNPVETAEIGRLDLARDVGTECIATAACGLDCARVGPLAELIVVRARRIDRNARR